MIFGCNSLKNEDSSVIDSSAKFWNYIKRNKLEKAWRMGTKEFRTEYTLDDFISNMEHILSNDVKIVEVHQIEVYFHNNKSCIVMVEIIFNEDKKITLYEDWILEENRWCFNGGGRKSKQL